MTSLTSVLTAERVSILLSLCPLLLIKLKLPLAEMHVFPDLARFCKKLPFSIEQFPPFARRPNSRSIPYPPITRESRGALFFDLIVFCHVAQNANHNWYHGIMIKYYDTRLDACDRNWEVGSISIQKWCGKPSSVVQQV